MIVVSALVVVGSLGLAVLLGDGGLDDRLAQPEDAAGSPDERLEDSPAFPGQGSDRDLDAGAEVDGGTAGGPDPGDDAADGSGQGAPGAPGDGATDRDSGPGAGDPATPEDHSDPEQPSGGSDDPGSPLPTDRDDIVVPDVSVLEGRDAVYGQLLVDIDESERAMIGFQDDLIASFLRGSAVRPEEFIADIRAIASRSADRLEDVRFRLEGPLTDAAAREIRDRYVSHLDTWVDYIRAVEAQPALLDPDIDTSRYALAINISAGAFSRALEELLPADVNAGVARFAEDILDRGFRVDTDSQV